jgi:hypothetical protein
VTTASPVLGPVDCADNHIMISADTDEQMATIVRVLPAYLAAQQICPAGGAAPTTTH